MSKGYGGRRAALPTHSDGQETWTKPPTHSKVMAFPGYRSLVTLVCAAFIAGTCASAFAQGSGDAKPPDQQKPPELKSEAAHLADVARTLQGRAADAECTHLGELAITLMAKNDLDTAFRHMDLYDRFGCPGAHIQQSFRCLLLAGIPNSKDSAGLESLVRNCWAPKAAQPAPAAAAPAPAAAPTPTPSTAGAGAR
jgi:hypothetical protein